MARGGRIIGCVEMDMIDVSEIKATPAFFVRIRFDIDASWSELYHWCLENCEGEFNGEPRYGIVNGVTFEKEEDAVMFSLRWK